MKKTIFFLAGMIVALASSASTYEFRFHGVKLSEALNSVIEQHPDLNLNFIYNELDNYTVNATIFTDDPYEALRRLVGLNPVSVTRKGDRFYLEALQHGKFAYSGTVVASDSEPLPGVAVMLLSPRDSTVITYGTTDAYGRFNIPCDHRDVIAKLTCVGYMPLYRQCETFHLGTLNMKESPVLLKGMDVNADLVQHQADITIYLPTNRQKNAANTATELLQRMAISRIMVNATTHAVTTTTGQEVKLFINQRPASSEELNGMLTRDVRRVELLENPTDPRYMGAQYAINFIVQEYEYGGYTKITDVTCLFSGMAYKPQLFSKFTYKNMTYDIFVGPDIVDTHHVGNDQKATFHLADATVERNNTFNQSILRYTDIPVSLRANYKNDRMDISNALGFTFHDRSTMINEGTLTIEPSHLNDYSYSTVSPFINRTFVWNGKYYFDLGRNWSMFATPRLIYGHNNSYSNYTTTEPGFEPIINNAREDVTHSRLDLSLTKVMGKHTIGGDVDGGHAQNRLHYFGSSTYDSRFSNSHYSIAARYKVKWDKAFINADGGFAQEFIHTNTTDFSDLYPYLHVSAGYSPNQKNSLNLWFQYATDSPEEAQLSPNVIQNNEFLYYSGNPDLRNSRHTTAQLSYNFSPNNKLDLSTYICYYVNHNRYITYYELYNQGSAVLRTYLNNGNFTHFYGGIRGTLRLLGNNLILQASGSWDHYKSTGIYLNSKTPVGFNIFAQYYTGKFNFVAYFNSGQSSLDENSPSYSITKKYYYIGGGWSNSDWRINLYLLNFFRTRYNHTTTVVNTPVYSFSKVSYNGNYHINLQISVAYTFGYGKKIQRSNEVGSMGKSSSAIMQ